MDTCKTRPDFLYEDLYTLIYVDGPVHEFPDRKERDEKPGGLPGRPGIFGHPLQSSGQLARDYLGISQRVRSQERISFVRFSNLRLFGRVPR